MRTLYISIAATFLAACLVCCNQDSQSDEYVLDIKLTFPPDGATGIEPGTEFQWTANDQAVTYDLIIESHEHNTGLSGLRTNSATVTDMRYGTDYLWKVQATNSTGLQVNTKRFLFTTKINHFVLDENFDVPQLQTHRRISVYLPPDYDQSSESYPTFYLHDGQDVFQERNGLAVDKTLDKIFHESRKSIIIVAIDNSNDRFAELSPWVSDGLYHLEYAGTGGKGDQYLAFIVEILKPHIDSIYRTKPEPAHTGIGGFSLGGLISFYAVMKHPDIFGKCGLMSPSFTFVDDKMFDYAAKKRNSLTGEHAFYFFAGDLETWEGGSAHDSNLRMIDSLRVTGFENYMIELQADGGHSINTARAGFPDLLRWLYF